MPRNTQADETWSSIRQSMDEVANREVRDRKTDQAIEKLNLSPRQQAAIKLYAERAGDQIGRLFTSLIEDGLTIILSGKQSTFTSSTANDTNTLLNADDVGKALGISKSLAYRLMRQREITCVQFGRSVRVRPEDLEEFIKNKSIQH